METWWWNEEVAKAVRDKKIKYGKWKKKTPKRQGWSIRRADKMQKESSLFSKGKETEGVGK